MPTTRLRAPLHGRKFYLCDTPAILWHPCHSVAPLPFGGTPAFLWQMVLYVYNTFGFMIHCVEPLQPIVSYPVQY
jgi:hypothetical protein